MLRATHVVLAPLTESDVPLLHDWINDRELVLWNAPYKPVSSAQHRAWFDALAQRRDLAIFGVRLLDGGRLIGSCQLHSIDPIHRSAELQIRIGAPDQRGKGYGTEATRLLLEHAFKDLNLHRVSLHVFATNARAVRAYEKAGFTREGVLREAAYVDGRYVDVIVMAVLRDGAGRPA